MRKTDSSNLAKIGMGIYGDVKNEESIEKLCLFESKANPSSGNRPWTTGQRLGQGGVKSRRGLRASGYAAKLIGLAKPLES